VDETEPSKVRLTIPLLRTVTVKGMGSVDEVQRWDNSTKMEYIPEGGVEVEKTFSTGFWVTSEQRALAFLSLSNTVCPLGPVTYRSRSSMVFQLKVT